MTLLWFCSELISQAKLFGLRIPAAGFIASNSTGNAQLDAYMPEQITKLRLRLAEQFSTTSERATANERINRVSYQSHPRVRGHNLITVDMAKVLAVHEMMMYLSTQLDMQ